MNRLRMTTIFAATFISAVLALGATEKVERCHNGTLLDVASRTDLVPTVSTQRVEEKTKNGKTVYTGQTTPDMQKRTTYTVQVAVNGMIYTAESSPLLGPFSYTPTDLVVGDPIEACVDGKSLSLTRPNGKQYKAKITRTARDTKATTPEPASSPNSSKPEAAPKPQAPHPEKEKTSSNSGAAKPKPFDQRMKEELSTYIRDFLRRTEVPGASVAIVQNGKVVYEQGFGVREQGKPEPVTPETMMMIGSTGKSMTTMMMASLVDAGKISWETRAVTVYPDFAVGNPALTSKITLRNTVCNCTGMHRHDLEMSFTTRPRTAAETIRSIRAFPFTGEFGKTFGYVNQMVATGGYIAAWADRETGKDLYENYVNQLQKRVFDPIGMTSTTFSFERIEKNPNHATPHGQTAAYPYVPIGLNLERSLVPYAPAGASWSNVRDMARYLITQLNRGIAPDGSRVVSAENLMATWEPQVEVQPGIQYGLGWLISSYKDQRIMVHAGGTSGFSSELAFLPAANFGLVILSNAQNANLFVGAVRSRILKLAFGEPIEMGEAYSTRLDEAKRQFAEKTARIKPLNASEVTSYLGTYRNATLGVVQLSLSGSSLLFKAGEVESGLRNLGGDMYLVWDPPMAGALIQFSKDQSGNRNFVLDAEDPNVEENYTFTRVPTDQVLD